jgi:hypothetical protein
VDQGGIGNRSQTDLINALAGLQEYGRQDGNIYETKLDSTRGQLEHDSVVALRDARQPFRRARSEQLMREKGGRKSKTRRGSSETGTNVQESVERCPGVMDPAVGHRPRAM